MGSRRSIVAFCVLLVLTLVAYAPAFRAGWIWGDQQRLGEGAHAGLGTRDFRMIWHWPCAESAGDSSDGAAAAGILGAGGYAPVADSVLWLEHRLFAQAPLGYHLISVWLHLVAAWLLWMLLRRLGLQWGALLGAALFAVHPLNAETVAWIAQQGAVLGMVFSLASALAWLSWAGLRVKTLETTGRGPVEQAVVYAVAILFLLLAILSTPLSIVTPIGLLMIAWTRQGRLTRRVWLAWTPLAVIAVGYGIWLYIATASSVNAAQTGAAMAALMRRIIAPVGLSWIHAEPENWLARLGWLAAIIAFAAAIGLRRRWTRGPLVAALFFAAAVLTAVLFLDDAERTLRGFPDRLAYFAAIPVVALVGAAAALAVRRRPKAAAPLLVASSVVVVVMTALTLQRAWCFGDELRLAQDTLAKNPHATLAAERVADSLIASGDAADRDKGALLYQQVMQSVPARTSAARSYARILAAQGKTREAQDILSTVLKQRPDDAVANEALADLVVQSIGSAAYPRVLTFYEKAFEQSPGRARSAEMLATIYESLGRTDDARKVLEKSVPLNARNSPLHFRYAGLLAKAKKWDQSNAQYDIGCALDPANAQARADWGQMLLDADRPREAETQFRKALDLNRISASYRVLLGKSLREQRKLGSALNEFKAAYELDDKLAVAYYEAAATYVQMPEEEDNVERYLQAAIHVDPNYTAAKIALARLFMTATDPDRKNIYRGISLLRNAVEATHEQDVSVLAAYAMALAQAQEYDQAIDAMNKALAVGDRQGLFSVQRELLIRNRGQIEVAAGKAGVVAAPLSNNSDLSRISLMGTGMEFTQEKPLPPVPQLPAKDVVMRPMDLSQPPIEEKYELPKNSAPPGMLIFPAPANGPTTQPAGTHTDGAATQPANQGSMK